ncbi:hypothetical protein ACQY0O_007223 [Thecaphora frezii]
MHPTPPPTSLLSWTPSLSSHLTSCPFRPFRATLSSPLPSSASPLPLLYKLAFNVTSSQLFLLLLDPATCTVFGEGVTARTLLRRVQFHPSSASHAPTMDEVVEAFHHALNPPKDHGGLKRKVELEATRFAASLLVDVRETHADGEVGAHEEAERYRFKVAFDLDPLDSAATRDVLERHFIGPLWSVACHVARTHNRAGSKDERGGQETMLNLLTTYASHTPSKRPRLSLPSPCLPSPQRERAESSPDSSEWDETQAIFFGPRNTAPPSGPGGAKSSMETALEPAEEEKRSSPPMFMSPSPSPDKPDSTTVTVRSSRLEPPEIGGAHANADVRAGADADGRQKEEEEEEEEEEEFLLPRKPRGPQVDTAAQGSGKAKPLPTTREAETTIRPTSRTRIEVSTKHASGEAELNPTQSQNLSQTQSLASTTRSQKTRELERRKEIHQIKQSTAPTAGTNARRGARARF